MFSSPKIENGGIIQNGGEKIFTDKNFKKDKSCLKILILFFCHLKSIRIKKILVINDQQTKLEHLKNLVKKNRHFDLSAIWNF
jgi:hypothetical protein